MKEIHPSLTTLEYRNDSNSTLSSIKLLPQSPVKPQEPVLRKSVRSIMKSRVLESGIDDEDSFFVADLGELVRQYKQWEALLPRIRPFYAVKCNPNPHVLRTLADCGAGFDCASKAEVQLVLEMGSSCRDIIYANPCKQRSHIRFASERGVDVMTFDNEDELFKIKKVAPNTKLVLRILTDDSKSLCRFGIKFGASLEIVPKLLRTAQSLNLNVIGISFHVGSGCYDATSFVDAVVRARKAFDIGAALGFDFRLLDIGGGFPGNHPEGLQFKDVAKVLGPKIDELFPPSIEVIAEPGRYFACSAFTLAVNVVARRVTTSDSQSAAPSANDQPSYMYYVNDGMYGSFNCITFDHAVVKAFPLCRSGKFNFEHKTSEQTYESSIWGPTCDSIDLLQKQCYLPEMQIGDWLGFSHMGAYTVAAASTFNGFKKSSILYTNTFNE